MCGVTAVHTEREDQQALLNLGSLYSDLVEVRPLGKLKLWTDWTGDAVASGQRKRPLLPLTGRGECVGYRHIRLGCQPPTIPF